MSAPIIIRLNDKQKRMVEDDTFFDVTPEDVKGLLNRMTHMKKPRTEIIRMRIKYDAWIDDCEKRHMVELGLDYRQHVITTCAASVKHSAGQHNSLACTSRFIIDGYTINQWKMLTDENYVPPQRSLTCFLTYCKENNDAGALETLMLKYHDLIAQRDKKILEKQGIPLDSKYDTLTHYRIDGMTFYRWKLLNDDEFKPSKRGVLISTIQKLRDEGYVEDAELIEQKYLKFLYPQEEDPNMQEQIAVARRFFQIFYPYSFLQ